MSIENAVRNRVVLLEEVGKTVLNIMYPNEFELYLCALELMDQEGNSLRYFVFPVMPSSIDEGIPQITNIKKTLAGVTALNSPTFVPTDIVLSGNFGRSFKVLLGTDFQDLISSFTTTDNQVTGDSLLGGAATFFDNRIKTGYGCIKILQDIIEQSKQVDSKGIRRLVFYNPALGNNYLVKPGRLRFTQSQESNMIWNYVLPLTSIAPLEAIQTAEQMKDQRERLDTTGYAQKQTNNLINSLTTVVANTDNTLSNQFTKKWK